MSPWNIEDRSTNLLRLNMKDKSNIQKLSVFTGVLIVGMFVVWNLFLKGGVTTLTDKSVAAEGSLKAQVQVIVTSLIADDPEIFQNGDIWYDVNDINAIYKSSTGMNENGKDVIDVKKYPEFPHFKFRIVEGQIAEIKR